MYYIRLKTMGAYMSGILEKLGLRKQKPVVQKNETPAKTGLTDDDITESLSVYAALSGDNGIYIYFNSAFFGAVRNYIVPVGEVYVNGKMFSTPDGVKQREFVRTIDGKQERFYNTDELDKYFSRQNIPAELHFSTIGFENRRDLLSQGWRTCVYRISETKFNELPNAQKNFILGLSGGNTLKSDIVKMQIMQQQRGIAR